MENRLLNSSWASLLLVLALAVNLQAQGWERIYFAEPNGTMSYASSSANKIFLQADGSFIFGANVQGQQSFLYTDADGLITDLQNVPNAGGTLIESTDGNYVYAYRSFADAPPEEDVYLRKYDENGNILWTHSPRGYLFGNEAVTDLIQTSTGDYVIVGGQATFSPQRLKAYITKVDEAGNTVWKQESVDLPETNIFDNRVVETPDGGFFMIASSSWFTENNPIITSARKVDVDGDLEWMGSLETDLQVAGMLLATDGNILLLGRKMSYEISLLKIDDFGNTIWEMILPNTQTGNGSATSLISTNDGGFAFLMNDISSPRLVKTDAAGNIEWTQTYGGPFQDYAYELRQLPDSGYVIAGSANGIGEDQSLYIIRTDELGNSLSDLIEGYVTYDVNEDCLVDANNEQGLEDWIVSASGPTGTFYAAVTADGSYQIEADSAEYTVALAVPNDYWLPCLNDILIQHNDTTQVDFAVQSVAQCPLMEVEIQNLGFRLCEEARVNVFCRNEGTELAEDVYVEISLNDSLELVSATVPYTEIGPNTYSFTVGDIDFLDASTFSMQLNVGCAIELMGQSLCMEAHIFPDSTCLPIDDAWTGASVEVRASCENGEARFIIENVGTADMLEALNYTVVEDHVIMIGDQSFGPLIMGEMISVPFDANGSYYRMESEQEPNHPGMSMPSAFIEGCGTNEMGEVSLGFVNQYPFNDADFYIDINCTEVLAAYDPNAKSASPAGYDEAHYIEANSSIDYTIQFQNVGTAPARTVVLMDRLSPVLNPATIRAGVSSHPYDFELLRDGVVRFTFKDIYLPDSTSNEAASQGFVQFSISQDPDLAIGTVIENTASIYFDSNPSVITNKTTHTIGQDFVTVNVGEILLPDVSIIAYPNPFTNSTTIELEGELHEDLTIQLLDTHGRLLKKDRVINNRYEMQRGNLPTGTYFYQIIGPAGLINSGRIIAQ